MTAPPLTVADLGSPDIIGGMKYGGTRYLYRFAMWVDHVEAAGVFTAYFGDDGSGKRARNIGEAPTLEGALEQACTDEELRAFAVRCREVFGC